jgi:hypothetical protein
MEKAYHEAGHAVAASVLGTPIKQATLDGVITLVRVGCDQAQRNEAIIAMAGPAAEARAKSYSAEQSAEENAKRQLGGHGTEHAMRRARWLIEDNWDGIEKVAEALGEARQTHG